MAKSEHWYDRHGQSAHRTIGKNGKERATNIKDAREHGLFPSVTSILDVLSKPELEDWKFKQITGWCWRNQPKGEPCEAYHAAALAGAFQQVDDAADLGTRIHRAIEDAFCGRSWDRSLAVYVDAVGSWAAREGVSFKAHELRLVNAPEGYAGTTDAHIQHGPFFGICDFKTRKTRPEYPCTPWSGQAAQVAAYHVAMFGEITAEHQGVNVFISTTEPGRVEATWYDADTLRREYEFFLHAAAIWRHRRDYDPRITN